MLAKKLQILDAKLNEHQPDVYASLRPGITKGKIKPSDLREWFSWRDGQEAGEAASEDQLLSGWYRFISFDEGKSLIRSMQRAALTNPVRAAFFLTLGRSLLRSRPLLANVFGDGYFFETSKKTVVYRQAGEQDLFFESFDDFVDHLIKLSSVPGRAEKFLFAERKLLKRYFGA